MENRLKLRPLSSTIMCAALCFASAAFAQNTTNTKPASSGSGDQFPDLVEIDPFGGISLWGTVTPGLGEKLVDGGVGGIRVAVGQRRVSPIQWH